MASRAPRIPDRKISETLLHFAKLTPDSLAFADVLNNDQHLNNVRRRSAGTAGAAVLGEQLIIRKRTMFADDERLIGVFEGMRTEDGLNVYVEAKNPYSLPRDRA
jgi:hypothetical protein